MQVLTHPLYGRIRTTKDVFGHTVYAAKDVADALGYAQPYQAINRTCRNQGTLPIDTGHGVHDMIVIDAADVKAMAAKCRLVDGLAFCGWLFAGCQESTEVMQSELLPSLANFGEVLYVGRY